MEKRHSAVELDCLHRSSNRLAFFRRKYQRRWLRNLRWSLQRSGSLDSPRQPLLKAFQTRVDWCSNPNPFRDVFHQTHVRKLKIFLSDPKEVGRGHGLHPLHEIDHLLIPPESLEKRQTVRLSHDLLLFRKEVRFHNVSDFRNFFYGGGVAMQPI